MPRAATAVAMIPPAALVFDQLSRKLAFGLFVGDRDHFFERRDSGTDLHQAGLAQIAHPVFERLRRDIHRRAFGQDDALDRLGYGHHLVNADTALVAVVAGGAAHRPIRLPGTVELLRLVARFQQRLARIVGGLFAVLAQPPT